MAATIQSRIEMWHCDGCGETVEDTFDACWNCGASHEHLVDVFLINLTGKPISVKCDNFLATMKPGASQLIAVTYPHAIIVNGDIELAPGDEGGFSAWDDKRQVSGIGDDFLDEYNVPEDADYAFAIVSPGEGD